MTTPCPFEAGDLVYAYFRYSTESQNLDSQENAVRSWCVEHHLVLGKVFRDEGRSGGSTRERRGFLSMIEEMMDPNINPRPKGLVLWNSARFARDVDDAQFYKAQLRRARYRLHFMADLIMDGDEGRIIEAVIDYGNAKERKTRSMEARRGLRNLAEQGYWTGGVPPRGYRLGEPVLIGEKRKGDKTVKRFGSKFVLDPDTESRVRRAWQMRLAGANYHEIHRATALFRGVNSYLPFFSNLTYAGYRKCGELLVPDAHTAYVTREEFERVQRAKRMTRGNAKAPDGDAMHSRRMNSPYLLSGILFCGLCGAAMVGDLARGYRCYECGRQHREGRAVCDQHKVATWHVERFVTDWVADHLLTFDYLRQSREEINRALSGDRSALEARREQLLSDLSLIDKRVRRLIDSIEALGLTSEIQERLRERKAEARQMETELAGVEAALRQQRIEVSDEALGYVAEHMREELKAGKPEQVRSILRASIVRVELGADWLRLHYVPPLASITATRDGELQGLGEWRIGGSNP